MKINNYEVENNLSKYKSLINKQLKVKDSELVYFIINNHGLITYVNKVFQELTNYYSFELELKFYDKLNFQTLYVPSLEDIIKRVTKDKDTYLGKLNIKTKLSNAICLNAIFIPSYNKKHRLSEYICFSCNGLDNRSNLIKELK